ncbi:hypothetical protein K458DRAFT_394955 [Lentithecium fluviatile CBS 122367]|uniref:Uncharacterized protein n=1 Tax=Lentithecium fluviatile CBS 122367 TaxID=1168545 RepID=A0A6G1IJU0_9PLEO|nr:hypothetical protein K458DRAFT_394955 [Lentithecium fluviatile CBS 122367]
MVPLFRVIHYSVAHQKSKITGPFESRSPPTTRITATNHNLTWLGVCLQGTPASSSSSSSSSSSNTSSKTTSSSTTTTNSTPSNSQDELPTSPQAPTQAPSLRIAKLQQHLSDIKISITNRTHLITLALQNPVYNLDAPDNLA